jgi:hypothetical protein
MTADPSWDREAAALRRVHSPLLSSYGPPRCRHCDAAWPCPGAQQGEDSEPPWNGWLRGDDYQQAAALRPHTP